MKRFIGFVSMGIFGAMLALILIAIVPNGEYPTLYVEVLKPLKYFLVTGIVLAISLITMFICLSTEVE